MTDGNGLIRNRFVVYTLLLLIGIIPGALNFSMNSQGNSDDINVFYTRVGSMVEYISNFEYPSINPDFFLGEFNAYYPFPFLIASIFSIITGNVFLSASILRMVISLLSVLVFYRICRWEKVDACVSLVLAFLYSSTIYYLFELRVRLPGAFGFVFAPIVVYSLYRVLKEYNPKFEIWFIISSFFLILSNLALTIYIFYFGIIYTIFYIFSTKSLSTGLKGSFFRFSRVLLFVYGLASFYILFLFDVQNQMSFSLLFQNLPGFSGTTQSFIRSGISPASLFYPNNFNYTTFGVVSIALFTYSLFIKKINNNFTELDKYLLIMLSLTLIASFFPIAVAYLPFIGHTEYSWRSFAIAIFALVFLAKDGIENLIKKYSYPIVIGIVFFVLLQTILFSPNLFLEKTRYADDMEKFYASIDSDKVIRINYQLSDLYQINYPLCRNCVSLGAPDNFYANTRNMKTGKIWSYIDYAQRNPADIKINGMLAEKYAIVSNELVSGYLNKGYILIDSGKYTSLLENPNSTSVIQFLGNNTSMNLDVHRKGRVFFTEFEAPSNGLVLFKFTYHPLATVLDNGNNIEIYEESSGLISAPIEKGSQRIEFYYMNINHYYIPLLFAIIISLYYIQDIQILRKNNK